jgi:hypothetical protein
MSIPRNVPISATFDMGILRPPIVTSPPTGATATYLPLEPVDTSVHEPYSGERLFFQAVSDAAGMLTLTVSDVNNLGDTDATLPAHMAYLKVTFLGASMATPQPVAVSWPGGDILFHVKLSGDRRRAFLAFTHDAHVPAPTNPPIPKLGYILLDEEDPVGSARTKIFFISDDIPVKEFDRRTDVAVVDPITRRAGGGTGILGPMGFEFGPPQ